MENNKEKRLTLILYIIITAVLSVTGVVLRCISLSYFYDTYIGYYKSGAMLPIASNIFLAAAVLFFIVGYIFLVRKNEFHPESNRMAVRVAALLPAIAFISFAAIAVYRIATYSSFAMSVPLLMYLSIPTSLCGAGYFATVFFNKHKNAFGLALGFLTIVWFVVSIGSSYSNPNIPMNSPDKIIFQVACLGGMTFILSELRSTFSTLKRFVYIFSASVALLLLSTSAFPSIFVTLFGYGLYRYVLLPEDMVFLFVAIYVAVKLVSLIIPEREAEADGEEMPEAKAEESIEIEIEADKETETETEEETETEAEAEEINEMTDGETS